MTVCLANRPVKLTDMATAVGHSVVFIVAAMAQTFVFATKAKGNVARGTIVCGTVLIGRCRPSNVT